MLILGAQARRRVAQVWGIRGDCVAAVSKKKGEREWGEGKQAHVREEVRADLAPLPDAVLLDPLRRGAETSPCEN